QALRTGSQIGPGAYGWDLGQQVEDVFGALPEMEGVAVVGVPVGGGAQHRARCHRLSPALARTSQNPAWVWVWELVQPVAARAASTSPVVNRARWTWVVRSWWPGAV